MPPRETERLPIPLTVERSADVREAAARLMRAEKTKRTAVDIGRNALVFYLSAMAKCVACTTGQRCEIHGTDAVRPETPDSGPPSSEVDPEHHRRIKHVYIGAYCAARGLPLDETAPFGAKEALAVNRLIKKVGGVEKAEQAIAAAFRDEWWRSRATILTIASDPARHLGEARPANSSRSSLQRDTGYHGGDEKR